MPQLTKVGIVVGEASGDLLGAGLVAELKKRYPNCRFEGIGGDRMLNQGVKSLVSIERLSVMGIVEPLKRLPDLLRVRKQLENHFSINPPDVVIGIDYPEFNLSLEKRLRKKGIPCVHYVSPSVWAWRQGRIKGIAKSIDLMLALFPFEQKIYSDYGIANECVGHPLADDISLNVDTEAARIQLTDIIGASIVGPIVAILPGSRRSEVSQLCRCFFDAARLCTQKQKGLNYIVPAANEARLVEIQEIARDYPDLSLHIVKGYSHELMAAADVVLMASGTTTLEALLLKKPMVIAYRMAAFSYWLLSKLVKSKFIGLPNLLANKNLVPELIQKDVTPEAISREIVKFLESPESVASLTQEFDHIHRRLRKNASIAAADAIEHLVEQKQHD